MRARYKFQTLAAKPLSGQRKILHTLIGMGSAALAAAVSYSGKATRKGQRRRKECIACTATCHCSDSARRFAVRFRIGDDCDDCCPSG